MALFGRPASRLDELRKIVDKDPSSRQFLALAEEYRKAGKTREVIETLERGLRQNPSYIAAHVALGRAYQALNRLDDGIKAFQAALKYDRDNLVAIRQLGDCYLRKGDKVEAIKKLKLFRGLSPGDKEVNEIIAQLDFELNPPKHQPAPPRPRVETWPNVPIMTKSTAVRRTSSYAAAQPSLTASGRFTLVPKPLTDFPTDTTKPIGTSASAGNEGLQAAGQSPRTEPISPPPVPPPPPLITTPPVPSFQSPESVLSRPAPAPPAPKPTPPRPSPQELLEMTFDGSFNRGRSGTTGKIEAPPPPPDLPEPPTVKFPVSSTPQVIEPSPLVTPRSEISTAPVEPRVTPPSSVREPLSEQPQGTPEPDASGATGVDELFAHEQQLDLERELEAEPGQESGAELGTRAESKEEAREEAKEEAKQEAKQEAKEPGPEALSIIASQEIPSEPPEPPAASFAEPPFEAGPQEAIPSEEPFDVPPPPVGAANEAPVVSETLAELYREQGYVEEAKEAYRALADAQPDEARAVELREKAELVTGEVKTPLSRLRALARKLPSQPDVKLDDMMGVLRVLLERTPGVRAVALTDLEGLPVVTAGNGAESPTLEILIAELTAFCKNLQRSRDDVGSLKSFALLCSEGGALVSGISSEYSLILQLDPGATLGKVRYEAARAANLLKPALG